MHVYPKNNEPDYYTTEPAHLAMSILDSNIFMYIVLILTLLIVCGAIYGVFKLHHIPKNKWHKEYTMDIGLINILSLLGWIWHSLWVVAIIIAFINWKSVESILIKFIQKALNKQDLDNIENK